MFEIKNIVDSPSAEINIFGDIGEGWFSEGVTVDSVVEQLNGLQDKEITCNVNSLGGDLFHALAIYDVLRMHPKTVTTKIVGATASAGTVIAMAGKTRQMSKNAAFLIHQAQGFAGGNADELLKESRELAKFDGILASLYAEVTGKPSTEMYNLMKQEVWQTAETAKDYGFITDIFNTNLVLNHADLNNLNLKVKPLKITNIMTEDEIKTLQDENLALKAQVEELTAKLAEIEAAKAAEQAAAMETEDDAIIDAACGDGKIPEEMKNHFKNLMKSNRAETREILNAMPKPVKRAMDVIRNQAAGEKTPKQLFNERLKANFYVNNKDAYRADFKSAFGYEPKPIN